jgi:hypothetical protein
VASYVARLPPCADVTEWAKTLEEPDPVSTPLAHGQITIENQAYRPDKKSGEGQNEDGE